MGFYVLGRSAGPRRATAEGHLQEVLMTSPFLPLDPLMGSCTGPELPKRAACSRVASSRPSLRETAERGFWRWLHLTADAAPASIEKRDFVRAYAVDR
jgi:hypothetical protein